MTDLLTELEALVAKWDTHLSSRYYSKELAILLAAEKARGPDPLAYCASCNKSFATHSPFCPLCGEGLEDADSPDPLLVQAREALAHVVHGVRDKEAEEAVLAALDERIGGKK